MKATWKSAGILLMFLAGMIKLASAHSAQTTHYERLRVRNTFKSPEEVVRYYCARDASGFVWSGLLDSERTAFTHWNEAPQHDSFYIARQYEVKPAERIGHDPNQASVQVRYDLVAIGDAQGTRSPAPSPQLKVTFDLKKTDGVWKIIKPDAAEISPVVLESKFQTHSQPNRPAQ